MKKHLRTIHEKTVSSVKSVYKRITGNILTKPVQSFFGVLGVLFLCIIVGSWIGKPAPKKEAAKPAPKKVTVHAVGSSPKLVMTAQVETSGIVKIIAQSSGIVQELYVHEGDSVDRGSWIAWLSTNYQGGTTPTVLRQIAQKNYDFVKDNYDLQKSLIDRQRTIADTVFTQSGDLRGITGESIEATRSLITFDQEIVDAVTAQIAALESSNVNGANDALILQAKQGKAGAQAAINALKSALASAEYQSAEDKPPAGLSDGQHGLTIAQLELQQKSLDLNRELSLLNLRVSQISEALMYPASPVAGTVERVYVEPGQNVTVGTVLATVTGTVKASSVVLLVPETIARSISRIEPSRITAGSEVFDLTPAYISGQPTDGTLYSVIFRIPATKEQYMVSGSSVRVAVPIGGNASSRAVPVIPIDAVYQTQSASYIFVAEKSKGNEYIARAVPVTLGTAFGSFVEVTRGITDDTAVITSRSVIAGDRVSIE